MTLRFRVASVLALLATVMTCAASAAGQEWTRFRGPNGMGVSRATTIPVSWTAKDYNWRVKLPGIGYSSPVIWGDQVFVTSTDEEKSIVFLHCIKTSDGETIWQRRFKALPHPKYKSNCDAATTPAVDDEYIFVTWGTPDQYIIQAVERASGEDVWSRDLGPYVAEDGFATSPVLWEDLVLLCNDQDEGGKSFLTALDRATGETRWRIERLSIKATFSTPCIYQPEGGRPQAIFASRAHGISSIDPRTGKINWELDVFELRTTGSPLVSGGMVFATNGGGTAGKYMVAVRLGIPETGVQPEVVYEIKESTPYVPTPVAHGKLLFIWSDKGIATCLDAATGKVHWRERVGGTYLGSPVCVAGRLYCISREGDVVVLAASDKYQELARVSLEEVSDSTPSIADGVMYLRSYSHLMSLGGKK